jgi:hypothetical protein
VISNECNDIIPILTPGARLSEAGCGLMAIAEAALKPFLNVGHLHNFGPYSEYFPQFSNNP